MPHSGAGQRGEEIRRASAKEDAGVCMEVTARAAVEHRSAVAKMARTPFRTPARRKQYEGMVADYVAGRNHLFRPDGRENRRKNIGEAFWRGVHGERFIWDEESPIYVAYKAGAAIAKASA